MKIKQSKEMQQTRRCLLPTTSKGHWESFAPEFGRSILDVVFKGKRTESARRNFVLSRRTVKCQENLTFLGLSLYDQ